MAGETLRTDSECVFLCQTEGSTGTRTGLDVKSSESVYTY